ncbi:MAG: thiolase family protein [Myxococcota bacterium]
MSTERIDARADDDCVLIAGRRTPFGRFGGSLRALRIPELASVAIRATLADAGLEPEAVDELILGVNLPGSDRSIARQALLRSDIPASRNAFTVDRACCSSLTAVALAMRAVRSGDVEWVVAGGAENLSRVPYFLEDLRWGHRLGAITLTDQLVISCPHTGTPRAVQAAREAARFGIDRKAQDEWAFRSHARYFEAAERGVFEAEIAPVDLARFGGSGVVRADESARRTSLEALAALPTVYQSESVTAGNAPGLSTGASALLLTTRRRARDRGLRPLATIQAHARVSDHPDHIASVPAKAARRVLERAGIGLDAIDLVEINEAFAAMPLVSTHVLGGGDPARIEAIRRKTNPNGGAIAIGHPTGATGGRLLLTAALELRRRGGGRALVTLCGGIGEGEAFVLNVDRD